VKNDAPIGSGSRLARSFYARDAALVAHDLIGVNLHRVFANGRRAVGRIVETEAYLGPHDLASHARAGRTARTAVMFGPPGRAYMFLIYGMYWCLNVVTGEEGTASAVLVRAIEPLSGIDSRTDGPGKLCRALAIDRVFNGADLRGSALFLTRGRPPLRVRRTRRIGVDYARHWARRLLRFVEPGNPYLSR
jgi:DNA-3-methyladenine glycosylase